ncbi:MAG: flavodoxin domain-containing protein [Eubacteriales bacterium]|nr:flavodoxin domain-containing protein [Eubacteriales bacterium]
MKVGIFYFTTTGNTEEMAQMIGRALEGKADYEIKAISDVEADDIGSSDLICLGSPAQGTEEMDDTEFMPFYEEHRDALQGKKVFLFGSFGWGDGQYMEDFSELAKGDGLDIVGIHTHLESPDDECAEALAEKVGALL